MDTLPASRPHRSGRPLSALLALTSLGSGLMHLAMGFVFLLAVAMGDGPRARTEPYVSPYTGAEFTFLVLMLVLAGLVLLPATYFAFISFRTTMILGLIAVNLDLLFLVVEAVSVDRGEPFLLDLTAGFEGILIVLVTWIGGPLLVTGLATRALRQGIPVIRREPGVPEETASTPRRLAIAMMIGVLYGLFFAPLDIGLANLALAAVAIGIPTFPRYAHWIAAPFVVIATMRLMLVMVVGPVDSLPGVVLAFLLTIVMLRLVLRGQRDLGIRGRGEEGYTGARLGHG